MSGHSGSEPARVKVFAGFSASPRCRRRPRRRPKGNNAVVNGTPPNEPSPKPAEAGSYRHLLSRYRRYAAGGRYDRWFARYSRATLRHALEAIPIQGGGEGVRLLDVACGTGLFAAMLRAERPRLRITGVDVSPDMLELAKRRLPPSPENGIAWKQGFAESLPVESGGFDVVTCTNAFHLVQDGAAAIREFRRVLKPGGTLVLVDWCLDYRVMRLRNAVLRIVDRQKRAIRTLDQMVRLVEDAGPRGGLAIRLKVRFLATPAWGMMCVVAARDMDEAFRSPASLPEETELGASATIEVLAGRPAAAPRADRRP